MPPGGSDAALLRAAADTAKAMGIALQILRIQDPDELPSAFSAFNRHRAQAVVVVRNQFMGVHVKNLADLAL